MARSVTKAAQEQDAAAEYAWNRTTPKASKRPVVMTFGRFNPPTTGHARLMAFLRREATKRKAAVVVFPSPTQDVKTNPLPFEMKARILQQMFPDLVVNQNPKVQTPLAAIAVLSKMGFDGVTMIVGNDQVKEFQRFNRYIRPTGLRSSRFIILKKFEVLPIARDKMTATKLRQAATANDFETFRQGTPTRNMTLTRQIFDTVRANMLTESFPKVGRHKGNGFLLYGMTNADATAMTEAFKQTGCVEVSRHHFTESKHIEPGHSFFVNVSGLSYAAVRSAVRIIERADYATYLYVKEAPIPRGLNESWIKQMTAYGLMRQCMGRDLITLSGKTGLAEMVSHAKRILESSAVKFGKTHEPSEVDGLKVKEKQETILLQKRQNDEMSSAKIRDLQKKSRDAEQAIDQKAKS